VQIGIGRCNNPFYAVCTGGLRYVWAVGGCNTAATPQDLGPANYGSHTYQIQIANPPGGDTVFQLKIDGVVKKQISLNDPRVSCWAWGHRNVAWAAEKWDAGDGLGLGGGPYL